MENNSYVVYAAHSWQFCVWGRGIIRTECKGILVKKKKNLTNALGELLKVCLESWRIDVNMDGLIGQEFYVYLVRIREAKDYLSKKHKGEKRLKEC